MLNKEISKFLDMNKGIHEKLKVCKKKINNVAEMLTQIFSLIKSSDEPTEILNLQQ